MGSASLCVQLLAFSIVIPIAVKDSFKELYDLVFRCFTVESCYHLISPEILLSYFLSMSRIFFSIFVNLSLICLVSVISFLLSFSQWMSSFRVIVLRLNPRFFVETFPFFVVFSYLLSASIISFFKINAFHLVSSVSLCLLHQLPVVVSIFFCSLKTSQS